jgi:4'-phosphopantetheinyl transferase
MENGDQLRIGELRCLVSTRLLALRVPPDLAPATFRRILEALPKHRQRMIQSFRRKEDALRSLLTGHLLQHMLDSVLESPASLRDLAYGPWGKPYLPERPDIHFNLSHSGDWVVGALGSTPVGVDVERMESIDFQSCLGAFSPEERTEFLALPSWERPHAFFSRWTLKESYMKATGEGLGRDPASFRILWDAHDIRIDPSPVAEPSFRQWRLDENHMLALCMLGSSFHGQFEILGPEYLNG